MMASMIGIVAGVALVLAVVIAAVARRSWYRQTTRAVERLVWRGRSIDESTGEHTRDELSGLPAPVVRYFEFALAPRQPRIRMARLRQVGTFAARRDAWVPFEASEVFTTDPPGFVWDARIRTGPLLSVRVRDSLENGVGGMRAALAGVIPVLNRQGTPQLASASLLRYLAEAVWLPTALLPAAGVTWSPISERCARATLSCQGVTASMDVYFGDKGEIVRIIAERYRDVNGTPVPTLWEGRFYDYVVRDGMRVPLRGEVGWHLADGWSPYWRGTIGELSYEYAPVRPHESVDERDHRTVGQANGLPDDVGAFTREPVPLMVGAPGEIH